MEDVPVREGSELVEHLLQLCAHRNTPSPEFQLSPVGRTHQLTIDYTNHQGKRTVRRVTAMTIWRGVSEYHEGAQLFLHAYDIDRMAERDFAIVDIHRWVPGWYAAEGPYAHPGITNAHSELPPVSATGAP